LINQFRPYFTNKTSPGDIYIKRDFCYLCVYLRTGP
jgi:hypothetical protein